MVRIRTQCKFFVVFLARNMASVLVSVLVEDEVSEKKSELC